MSLLCPKPPGIPQVIQWKSQSSYRCLQGFLWSAPHTLCFILILILFHLGHPIPTGLYFCLRTFAPKASVTFFCQITRWLIPRFLWWFFSNAPSPRGLSYLLYISTCTPHPFPASFSLWKLAPSNTLHVLFTVFLFSLQYKLRTGVFALFTPPSFHLPFRTVLCP